MLLCVSFDFELQKWTRTQWLLLQEQEDSVQQFKILGEVVELAIAG